jgi:mevalonate kinase
MKKIILILAMMFSIGLKCQDNIHNYIIGQWEFKINVKEVIKNSNELSGLEKIAARAFSGVIEKTLDETKILFDFKENKTVAIIVTTKKEETQNRVVFNWRIDKDDKLRLDEIYDQNQVRLGDTAYWVLEQGKLIPFTKEANINEGILLIKVK